MDAIWQSVTKTLDTWFFATKTFICFWKAFQLTNLYPAIFQNIGHWKKSLPYIFRPTWMVTSFKKVTKDWEQKCVCLIWGLVIPFRDNIFSERKQFNQRKDFLSTNNNLFTSVSSLKCSTILKSPQNCISNIQREIWWPKNN